MGQIFEGFKSAIKVAVATAINPGVGAAVLCTEIAKNTMTFAAGEEGTKAGDFMDNLMTGYSELSDSDRD